MSNLITINKIALSNFIKIIVLFISFKTYALGIGDIKLYSALNQNFVAEISLIKTDNESIDNFFVKMASPQKFAQAGIPWNYFLTKIKFDIVSKADGSAVIKLSSKERLKELFLHFLLEVNWINKTLYREFTVLLNPAYDANLVAQNKHANLVEKTPVLINKYSDFSMAQIAMSIYKSNLKAFYQPNINALIAKQKLIIPKPESIRKLSKQKALLAFEKQNHDWANYIAKTQSNQPKGQYTQPYVSKVPVIKTSNKTDFISKPAVEIDKKLSTTVKQENLLKPENELLIPNKYKSTTNLVIDKTVAIPKTVSKPLYSKDKKNNFIKKLTNIFQVKSNTQSQYKLNWNSITISVVFGIIGIVLLVLLYLEKYLHKITKNNKNDHQTRNNMFGHENTIKKFKIDQ